MHVKRISTQLCNVNINKKELVQRMRKKSAEKKSHSMFMTTYMYRFLGNSYRLSQADDENIWDTHSVQQIDNNMVKLFIFVDTQNHLSMCCICFERFCFEFI